MRHPVSSRAARSPLFVFVRLGRGLARGRCSSHHGVQWRSRRGRPRQGKVAGLRETGNMTGYLPGDPRYGLSGEALRNYYRTKLAQWAIYCWDKPGTTETRRGLVQDQKSYVENFGERVIGYGHFV